MNFYFATLNSYFFHSAHYTDDSLEMSNLTLDIVFACLSNQYEYLCTLFNMDFQNFVTYYV